MKKINKNLFTFTLIASFLGISLLSLVYKFIPTFFTHTASYCQLLINSYSIKIPHELNLIIVALILVISLTLLIEVLFTFIKIQRMKKKLNNNRKIVNKVLILAQKVGLKDKVSVVKDRVPFAFCLGIKNPHIYISSKTVSMATIRQLEAILVHEKYHLEHADSLTLFIGSLPGLFFPFFPFIPNFLKHYKIEREIKADRQAVIELGDTKPIIEVLKIFLNSPSVPPSFISSISDVGTLELRIQSLLGNTPKYPKIKKIDFLISMLSIGFIITSIAVPVQATEIHTNNQDTAVVCLENNRCVSHCKNNEGFSSKLGVSHAYSPVR